MGAGGGRGDAAGASPRLFGRAGTRHTTTVVPAAAAPPAPPSSSQLDRPPACSRPPAWSAPSSRALAAAVVELRPQPGDVVGLVA
eukprot:gene20924-20972_t